MAVVYLQTKSFLQQSVAQVISGALLQLLVIRPNYIFIIIYAANGYQHHM